MDFDSLNEIQHNEAVRKRLAKVSLDIWCDGPSEKKILPFLDPCMFSHNLLHEPSCMSRVDLSCLRLGALPAEGERGGERCRPRGPISVEAGRSTIAKVVAHPPSKWNGR